MTNNNSVRAGEGYWTIKVVIDEGVPAPVPIIKLDQPFIWCSQADLQSKLLPAMRQGFAGFRDNLSGKTTG
jgi:6-phosphogluconate dehydrogenase (decarboxylating)